MRMNYNIPYIPDRPEKPRNDGITMVMDKGLSVQEAENMISASGDFIDMVKFGFGTGLITKHLKDKIKLYQEAQIRPFLGGTIFEMFYIRDMYEQFKSFIDSCNVDFIEISDGSIQLPHEEKLACISELSKDFTVISEVGSKQKGVEISPEKWVSAMQTELEAGSWKVVGEARESGTVGIFNEDGSANTEVIEDIVQKVNTKNVIWEAPKKPQKVWFIKLLGARVNLGNLATTEIIPLETQRFELRGDTFSQYLP